MRFTVKVVHANRTEQWWDCGLSIRIAAARLTACMVRYPDYVATEENKTEHTAGGLKTLHVTYLLTAPAGAEG